MFVAFFHPYHSGCRRQSIFTVPAPENKNLRRILFYMCVCVCERESQLWPSWYKSSKHHHMKHKIEKVWTGKLQSSSSSHRSCLSCYGNEVIPDHHRPVAHQKRVLHHCKLQSTSVCAVTEQHSVLLQGFSQQIVQAGNHWPRVIVQASCDHGVVIDLQNNRWREINVLSRTDVSKVNQQIALKLDYVLHDQTTYWHL